MSDESRPPWSGVVVTRKAFWTLVSYSPHISLPARAGPFFRRKLLFAPRERAERRVGRERGQELSISNVLAHGATSEHH